VKIGCKADWDNSEMTKLFCNIVIEEIDAENRPLGTLNARGYKNLGEKFLARTGKNYTQKQLKNRWDNSEMTKLFCNIAIEEIDAENRPLGTLNARGYKN
jgi:hypothetical protein